MNRTEFKTQPNYLLALKDEAKDKKVVSPVRSREFYSLIPLLLEKYPLARIRDYLEVDGTFAVLFPKTTSFELLSAINLYLDLTDTLEFTTYTDTKQVGFINYEATESDDALEGFWVLVK